MKYSNIIISLVAGISLVAASAIFASAYKFKYNNSNTISVTGNAKMNFESDIVKWSASYSRKSMELQSASEQLSHDREQVRRFLVNQGISEKEIRFDAVIINRQTSYQTDSDGKSYNVFAGYNLSQDVSIESKDLDKVDKASRDISGLISQGLELSSNSPNYYFSGLEDLKLKLISQASLNAKQRANNIATEAGSNLGDLVKADLGVFQITGQNDNEEYSYGGAFNTTSRSKTANVTVKANYISK